MRAGIKTPGPVAVITDLCILQPEEDTRELTVASIHPGVTREQVQQNTGWDVRFCADCSETMPPNSRELSVLRDLKARTAAAHGVSETAA
jgi:glutaconate CoA-transferase subunit B